MDEQWDRSMTVPLSQRNTFSVSPNIFSREHMERNRMSESTAYLKLTQVIGRYVLININEIAAVDDKGESGRFIYTKNGTRFEVSETLSHIQTILEKWHNRIGA